MPAVPSTPNGAPRPSSPGSRPTAPGPAVEVSDLVVRYGDRSAVDGLSLTARSGEVVTLLGPNGAGKTTTVETLEGYRRPTTGRVRVLGLDPAADHRRLTPRIGVMLQRGGLYPMLGPRRALALFASYYDGPEDVDRLLDLVSLGAVAGTPWRHLSGGEQQRLALALALVGRPEVVFLDEPTAGIDPEGRLSIRQVVGDLRRRGVCILLTTHELDEAERLADRVVIVDRGRSVAAGSPAELVAAGPGGAGAVLTFGAPAGLDVRSLGTTLGAPVTEGPPGRYRIAAAGTPALTAKLASWLAERDAGLTDLRTGRTLEELYLSVVGAVALEPSTPEEAAPRPHHRRTRRGRAGS
jgi:ABC-2 type transport system ATP-binding protein